MSDNINDFADSLRRLSEELKEMWDKAEPQPATVDMQRGGSFATYTITGTLPAVLDAIQTIFTEYDPMGYGTKVESIIDVSENGTYTAKMWRALSSD